MDSNVGVPEVQHSEREPDNLRVLKLLVPSELSAERVEWMWGKLLTQDYVFDDTTAGDARFFLMQLLMPTSQHFELGDDGLISATGIQPGVGAILHVTVWGDVSGPKLSGAVREAITYLFTQYRLHRITAYIPRPRKEVARLAILLGFKFEGELRGAYLRFKEFHNVSIYGLLRSEWEKGVVH